MAQANITEIDHDKVCAVVVCAATLGTARVEPAVARPLVAAPAGATSAVPGVAAQTTIAQTAWVVNLYSTAKTRGTDFPSSAIERICGALNRLVSDVIINWHTQRARRKMSLIPSTLPNVLLVMVCRWIVGIVKTLKNDAMEPEEITNIEIYRLKFILKRHVFVLHVTSVNTESVQVTHRAVGARTMHGFGTDLVRNPAIWLVESRD